jgi:hypothetical protein
MPNPLTGDFDGILQVSGSTLNRLLASMHQNAFRNTSLPSVPHSVRMRIGDDLAFEGVRGTAHVQISVPRIELRNGVTDRFTLKVWARGWYRGDSGTEHLAQYINGAITAEYRLQKIDPTCPGWSKNAEDYLWFKVVRDSVTFKGSANDDIGLLDIVLIPNGDPEGDAAEMNAKITSQIARLLAKRFEATPHQVSSRFRRGALRSLSAPGVGSAIVTALPISGAPAGDIASVNDILLDGYDFAVAISSDYIMSLAQDMLKPFASYQQTLKVHVDTGPFLPDIDTVYHVSMNVPTATWTPQGSFALIAVKIAGAATTNSVLPNVTFEIDQNVVLSFDGSGYALSPGSWSSKVNVKGLYSGTVANSVSDVIKNMLPGLVQSACDSANPKLAAIAGQTDDLVQRLRSLDAKGTISLDTADFQAAGIVARGTIYLSSRHKPVIAQEKTSAGDAHSALESWIPGGRVDRFEWDWIWAGPYGETGSAKLTDRFLLQRTVFKPGRWGLGIGMKTPLPGLDGSGQVCLRIIGKVTDPVTGELVSVTSERKCRRFGLSFASKIDPYLITPPYLKEIPHQNKTVPTPPWKDRGLVAVGRNPGLVSQATNTLVVLPAEVWDGETADTLIQGINACRRYDAGLNVLILFKEGLLDAKGIDSAEIERSVTEIGMLVQVNEDVDGSWSRTLRMTEREGAVGWALIAPEGSLPWSRIGRMKPQELGAALDIHLRRIPDARISPHQSRLQVGSLLSPGDLTISIGDLLDAQESRCPPIPLGRMAGSDTIFAFVNKQSSVSVRNLRTVVESRPSDGATVVAIVEGIGPGDIGAWRQELGLDIVAIPDQSGKLGKKFGIDTWPTTMTVSADGMVSDLVVGVDAHGRNPDEGRTST